MEWCFNVHITSVNGSYTVTYTTTEIIPKLLYIYIEKKKKCLPRPAFIEGVVRIMLF